MMDRRSLIKALVALMGAGALPLAVVPAPAQQPASGWAQQPLAQAA